MNYRITPSRSLRPSYGRQFFAVLVAFVTAVASVPGSALTVQGAWQQGALITGRVEPGSSVQFAGRQVKTTPSGHFVLGVSRDAEPEAVITVSAPDGQTEEHRFAVAQRDYDIQYVEGVKSRHVTPPESVTQRIREEAAAVYNARQATTDSLHFLEPFEWPLKGPITGVYGSQRFYNGEPRAPHYGVDIAAPTGTPVKAPAGGVVTLADDDMYYSGGTLMMDHGYGVSSTFIHLHRILVEPGDHVERGQVVAEVGATGRATGPHLDWRMNWFNVRVDPQLFMQTQQAQEPMAPTKTATGENAEG